MKLKISIIFLLLISTASAVTYDSYTETVVMYKDMVHETIEIIANTNTSEENVSLTLTADVRNVNVLINDQKVTCKTTARRGSSELMCPLAAPVSGKYSLKVSFDSSYPLIRYNGNVLFRSDYTPILETNNFVYIVKLPLGYVIPEEEGKDLSFFVSPQPDSIYSDGRIILLRWEREALDETFDVSVIAEPVEKTTTPFTMIALVFIIIVLFFFISRRKGKKIVVESLLEREKKIVEELNKAKNHELWQKELQIKTELSKVKLTRMLQSLEKRGVITKEPYGKTNKIKLVEKE